MIHKGTQMLATDRLTLRRFLTEDAEDAFYNWAGDPEVTRYLCEKPQESVESTAALIGQWEQEYDHDRTYRWAIELNDLEQCIGIIEAKSVDDRLDSIELESRIGKKYWNRGYTSEALDEVLCFLMAEVGACRVWAQYDVQNIYAEKVMEHCGMSREGVLKRAGVNNTGIVDLGICAQVSAAAVVREEEDEEEISNHVEKVMGEDGKLRNVISDETMEYVGILAKLELSPEEIEAAKKDMADMLDYIDQLNELDTTGIEPMSHVFPVHNVFREDVVKNGDGREATLANAPVKKDNGFKVPKTIGE